MIDIKVCKAAQEILENELESLYKHEELYDEIDCEIKKLGFRHGYPKFDGILRSHDDLFFLYILFFFFFCIYYFFLCLYIYFFLYL